MTAQEAKQKANEMNGTADKLQYQSVIESIEKAANNGEFNDYCYQKLRPAVKNKLVNDGYKITDNSSQRDGELYLISWE